MNELKELPIKQGFGKTVVGKLTKNIINYFSLDCEEADIILWEDRLKHIEKHKKDFDNIEQFYEHINRIPEIINNPDYVGLHPKDNSIQYIKQFDKKMIVGVRLKKKGNLYFRSTYPLTEKQFNDYLKCGTIVKFSEIISYKDIDLGE